jgi:lipopolysaccharide transport system ATP-binding protein
MADVVIKVEDLAKRYTLGRAHSSGNGLRHAIQDTAATLFRSLAARRREPVAVEDFWALRDVSFELRAGEVMGVVGRNGAGKSTLLKILSRITEPTTGRVEIHGRVASLLEVGTGFHPELSGRENIFLNGAILGMTRAEIRRRFDEIVAFAEVERFLDTPVKRYSSGMYVRLAFAVAAHLEPEILIIDEVLAVGDMQFQKKCLGKMQSVAAKEGRTVLFVSHNLVAVQSLCTRALLLREGRLAADGATSAVIAEFLQQMRDPHQVREWRDPATAPGIEALRLKRVAVFPEGQPAERVLTMHTAIRIETEFWILQPGMLLHLTYHLLNEQGIVVLTSGCRGEKRPRGCYRASCVIPGDLLNSGGYTLKLLVVRDGNQIVFAEDSCSSFSVVDADERDTAYSGREPGVVQVALPWDYETVVDLVTVSSV